MKAVAGRSPGAPGIERRYQRAQPLAARAAVGVGESKHLGLGPRGGDGGQQVPDFLAGVRIARAGQDEARGGREGALGDVGRVAGGDDQLVVGIVERGERGQVFAQTFLRTFDRNDEGGGREDRGPWTSATIIPVALSLAAQREPGGQQRRTQDRPEPEHLHECTSRHGPLY